MTAQLRHRALDSTFVHTWKFRNPQSEFRNRWPLGNPPSEIRNGGPTSAIRQGPLLEVYAGIGLIDYSKGHNLEYDFEVKPNKPEQIRLAFHCGR